MSDAAQIYYIGTSVGMTRDEVDEVARSVCRRNVEQGIARGDGRKIEKAVTVVARERKEQAEAVVTEAEKILVGEPPATQKQIDYIMQLLAVREARGDGGGFMAGPTTRDGVKKLTKAQASIYITSLKEQY